MVFSADITGQAIILLLGGLFLIYKSTKEIHEKVDHKGEEEKELKTSSATATFGNVIIQILMIDLIFSVDSILTAVGMTNGVEGALTIMITAVVISVGIMMLICSSCWKFCKQKSINSNTWISFLNLNWIYVNYRKYAFIKC